MGVATGNTKHAPPACHPQTDSLRKFYTSTLEQLPDSEMAKKWWAAWHESCWPSTMAACSLQLCAAGIF